MSNLFDTTREHVVTDAKPTEHVYQCVACADRITTDRTQVSDGFLCDECKEDE